MSKLKCPTGKIVKAHTALDQALADWQESIRPYLLEGKTWDDIETAQAEEVTDNLIELVNGFRDMRVEAEQMEAEKKAAKEARVA